MKNKEKTVRTKCKGRTVTEKTKAFKGMGIVGIKGEDSRGWHARPCITCSELMRVAVNIRITCMGLEQKYRHYILWRRSY